MKASLLFVLLAPLAAEVVPTASVESRNLSRQTTQPVTAQAYHLAEFGSMVTGYLKEVAVDIGDRVTVGQVLAEVAVPELEQLYLSQQAQVRRVATDIKAAQARLSASKAEADRILALVRSETVTSKAGDEATARLEAARADLESTEAQLAAAEARAAETKAMLDYATLKAPFDGVVVGRSVDPGDLVTAAGQAGATGKPLFQIARTDLLRVVAHLPERDAIHAQPGDPVTLRFDALPGREIESRIARVASVLDPGTQRMRVEIDLPNPDGKLPAGLFGRATITLDSREAALVVPSEALRPSAKGPLVYLVKDGRVRHRLVGLGLDDGRWVEVTKGLAEGDRVVTGRIDRLADGAAVETR